MHGLKQARQKILEARSAAISGCGMCAQICPEVFEVKNDKAVVIANPVPREVEDKVKQAASECPVEAIKVE